MTIWAIQTHAGRQPLTALTKNLIIIIIIMIIIILQYRISSFSFIIHSSFSLILHWANCEFAWLPLLCNLFVVDFGIVSPIFLYAYLILVMPPKTTKQEKAFCSFFLYHFVLTMSLRKSWTFWHRTRSPPSRFLPQLLNGVWRTWVLM